LAAEDVAEKKQPRLKFQQMSESLTKPCLSFIYLYQTTEIRNITKKKKEENTKMNTYINTTLYTANRSCESIRVAKKLARAKAWSTL